MEDVYCKCGQYLTTYLTVVSKCRPEKSVSMHGVPCPAKGCEITYYIDKTTEGAEPKVILFLGDNALQNMRVSRGAEK